MKNLSPVFSTPENVENLSLNLSEREGREGERETEGEREIKRKRMNRHTTWRKKIEWRMRSRGCSRYSGEQCWILYH